MIHIKSNEEINKMRHGAHILSEVLYEVVRFAKVGVTELELDALAERLIKEKGGEPGFKKVKGYHYTICASTNDVVVHGIPTHYAYKEGDIAGIDCGVYYQGFHTDMAETVRIKKKESRIKDEKDEIDRFLQTGKRALDAAIKQAKAGNRTGHISKTIQDIVEKESGYSIVRSLVGHGVGRQLHEEPEVPGFLQGPIEKTPVLKPGMTIAIEVIYNMGGKEVIYKGNDDWTISTKDRSISGVFERTVLIADTGPEILTA